jgi:hypothetical protein
VKALADSPHLRALRRLRVSPQRMASGPVDFSALEGRFGEALDA